MKLKVQESTAKSHPSQIILRKTITLNFYKTLLLKNKVFQIQITPSEIIPTPATFCLTVLSNSAKYRPSLNKLNHNFKLASPKTDSKDKGKWSARNPRPRQEILFRVISIMQNSYRLICQIFL